MINIWKVHLEDCVLKIGESTEIRKTTNMILYDFSMLTDNLQDLDEGDVREVEKGLIKQINELNNTIQRIQVLLQSNKLHLWKIIWC